MATGDIKLLQENGSGNYDEIACELSSTTIATAPLQITSLSLSSGSWSLVSGLYEYDLSNANITANSIVDVIPDNADIAIVKAAEILPRTDSSSGSVKIYATNTPTDDIGITIIITEKSA